MSFAADFGKKLIDAAGKSGRPMTKEESHVLVSLLLMRDRIGSLYDTIHQQDPVLRVMESRLGLFLPGVDIDKAGLLWLDTLAAGNMGTAVMLTTIFAYFNSPNGGAMEATLSDLTTQAFPMGVPTKGKYHELWISQKGATLGRPDVDNILDREEAWTEEVLSD